MSIFVPLTTEENNNNNGTLKNITEQVVLGLEITKTA